MADLYLNNDHMAAITVDRFEIIEKGNENIIKMILSIDGSAIRFIDEPTEEQIEIAIRKTPLAIQYIPDTRIIPRKLLLELLNKELTEENVESHMVSAIKYLHKPLKFIAYAEAIKMHPDMLTHIVPMFESVTEREQILLWKKAIFEMCKDHSDQMCAFELCPKEIQKEVLSLALMVSPKFLEYVDSDLITKEHVVEYLKYDCDHIDWFLSGKCKHRFDQEPEYFEWYKIAIDNCTCGYEVKHILASLSLWSNRNIKLDQIAVLLESDNWPWVIDNMRIGFNDHNRHDGFTPEIADYVYNKFGFDTLCEACKYEKGKPMINSDELILLLKQLPYGYFKRKRIVKNMMKAFKERGIL